MVFQGGYCEICNRTCGKNRVCKSCQVINDFKNKKIINWTSGNEKIDNLIQEMHLKINVNNIVFKWIPYAQFGDIKELGKDNFDTVYSATWKDGPLYYTKDNNKHSRNKDKKVALKCLYNSQIITDEFLNEV